MGHLKNSSRLFKCFSWMIARKSFKYFIYICLLLLIIKYASKDRRAFFNDDSPSDDIYNWLKTKFRSNCNESKIWRHFLFSALQSNTSVLGNENLFRQINLSPNDVRTIFEMIVNHTEIRQPLHPQGNVVSSAELQARKQFCSEIQWESIEKFYRMNEVNCQKLFSGDRTEIQKASNITKNRKRAMLTDKHYLNVTENCNHFKKARGYITCPLSEEEEKFSIAYSIMVYRDIEMFERLLRSIYRPQNYYCVHMDRKVDTSFSSAVAAIVTCFPNVILVPDRVDVKWGTFSVVTAELVCMEQLWRYQKWKYFINLTGQEFPLKTNLELVRIFKAYNGANDIEGTIKRVNNRKWTKTPPHNITAVKGSVHIAVNRDFVGYILHSPVAKEILQWASTTSVPDETYFATLNHNPQLSIRGSYKGIPESENHTSLVKPFLTRFKNWRDPPFHFPCAGHYVRNICILQAGDLPLLGNVKHMFANKFFLWEDNIVVGCLEEMIFNNTRDETLGRKKFDAKYYSQLGFVKNQVI